MRYLLDTNVFIEAKNRYYGLDFCPAFWEWLIHRNTQGSVHSIEKVGDELAAGADDLAIWAVARGEAFFPPPDQRVLQALARGGRLGEKPTVPPISRGDIPPGRGLLSRGPCDGPPLHRCNA